MAWSDRASTTHLLQLLFIVSVAVALRLYLFGGYVGLDDGEYARFAYEMTKGEYTIGGYDGPAVFPLRVGLIFPASLILHVADLNDWSLAAYPFLLSLAGIALCYVCARTLFDRRAGILAAALMALMPIDVGAATELYPDLPAALFASLAVVVILALMQGRARSRRALLIGGLVAGLMFGLSWLAKETVAYFVPVCAALMVIGWRESGREVAFLWGGVALGSLFVLLAESAVYAHVAGDFLFRFHEIERNYRQWPNGFFSEGSDFGWPDGSSRAVALVKRLFIAGPKHIFANDNFLFLPLIAVVGTIHAWRWRQRAFVLPAVWLLCLLFMFNFSSSSLSSYSPLPLFNRYFYPIAFPSIVLSAGFLAGLTATRNAEDQRLQRERVFWGASILLFLLFTASQKYYWSAGAARHTWTSEVRAAKEVIEPSTRLYADTLSLRALSYLSKYPDETAWHDFQEVGSYADIEPGSLVLVNSAYIGWLQRNRGMWLNNVNGYKEHEFYKQPPPSWQRVLKTGNAVLYEVK